MNLAEVALVVLDIDDTVYLERDFVRSGFRAVGQLTTQLGIGDISDELWTLFVAGVRNDTFDRVLRGRDIPPEPELVQRMVDTYRSHPPDISLLDDAKRLLSRVEGKPTALITDGPPTSQWAKIHALGLDASIGWCVLTAELGEAKSKPHPAAFELVQRLSEKEGKECIYIGDNPNKDFEAPRAMGWWSVRVRRPESLYYDEDTPSWVDAEIASLDEL